MSAAADAAHPGALLARLEREAQVLRTPCGEGDLVWHVWGSGPPLVLLHGGFGSWTHWVRNVGPLARRWRVVAVDLPGLGDSALPPDPVEPAGLGRIVGEGLERVLPPDGPVHLVGFSFGGLVGGQVALRLGPRLAALVMVGASGLGVRRPSLELVRREEGMDEAARHRALRENLRRLMIHDEAAIDALALHVHARNDARARLRSRRMSLGDSLRAALEAIEAPVHGIWGAHDATVGPWMDERRALVERRRAGGRFVVLPGAGHWVQYEAPRAFEEALQGLLGR